MEADMRVHMGTDRRWGWGERNGARMEKEWDGVEKERDGAGVEVRGGLGEEVETELGTWKWSGRVSVEEAQAESPGAAVCGGEGCAQSREEDDGGRVEAAR